MNSKTDPLVDPLIHDWNEAATKDDWGVPAIYEPQFRRLVTKELVRLADQIWAERKSGDEDYDSSVDDALQLVRARARKVEPGSPSEQNGKEER